MNNKMKIFYCLALIIILECQSIFTLPTVTPRTSPQPVTPAATCDILAITTCLGNVSYDIFSSLRTSPEYFGLFCQRFKSSKACVAPYLANGSCSGVEAVGIKAVINGYDYMCSDRGLQVIELFGTCFGSSIAISGLQQCSADIAKHVNTTNLCTLPEFYMQCSLNVSEMYCNKNVSRGLLEFILTFFQSYTEVYNCNYNVPDLGTLPTRKPTSPSWVTQDVFSLRPQTSKPAACSVRDIGQCLSNLSGSNSILPWQRAQITDIDLDVACIAYNSVKDCYKKATNSCLPLESIQYDLLVSMYEYVCTPSGKQQFRSLYECFSNQEAMSRMSQCRNTVGLDPSDYCSFPNHFISCANNVSRDYCNSSSALPAIVRASFKPYQTALNCDLTPNDGTPTTSLPRPCSVRDIGQCLSSLSGSNSILPWQHAQITDIDLDVACIAYNSVKDCYKKATSSCLPLESIQYDLLVSMYEYVCTPSGKQQFRSVYECFGNQEVRSKMSQCGNTVGLDPSDYCSFPDRFTSCANDLSRDYCNSSPALPAIVRAAFKPYQTVLNCTPNDDTPTTSLPRLCSTTALVKCLRNLTTSAIFPWQKGTSVSVNNVDIGETCSALESAQDCYYKEVNYCDAKVSLDTDLLMSMYTYVCSAEGQKDYRSARECYKNQEALSSMTKCGDVSGVDVSDYCNVPKHFMRCADEASRNCSSALTNIVKASFKPYETAFSCDLSDYAGSNSYPTHSGCPGNCLDGFDYYVDLLEKRSMSANFSLVEFTNACKGFNQYSYCVSTFHRNCTRRESKYQFAVRNLFTYVCNNNQEINARTQCYNTLYQKRILSYKIVNSDTVCRKSIIILNEYIINQCDKLSDVLQSNILKLYYDVLYFKNYCDTIPQPEVEPEGGPEVEPEGGPEVEPEGGPEVEPEGGPEVEPEVEPEGGPEVEPEGGPEVEPEVGSKGAKFPIKCYDCNSGSPLYRNENCPTNGVIDESKTSTVTCEGHCFSRHDRWQSGVVHRGCSSWQWLPEFNKNPSNGCRNIRGVLWCFCDTDKCNTRAMDRTK